MSSEAPLKQIEIRTWTKYSRTGLGVLGDQNEEDLAQSANPKNQYASHYFTGSLRSLWSLRIYRGFEGWHGFFKRSVFLWGGVSKP